MHFIIRNFKARLSIFWWGILKLGYAFHYKEFWGYVMHLLKWNAEDRLFISLWEMLRLGYAFPYDEFWG